jgi:hypothetical protein
MSYLTHADRSIDHAFEKVSLTSKLWLLLQHVLLVQGGQFDPESRRQFPAEILVSLQRIGGQLQRNLHITTISQK